MSVRKSVSSQRTSAAGNKPVRSKSRNKKPRRSKSGRWLLFVIGMGGIAVLSGLAGALLAVSDSTPLQQANLTPEQASVFARNPISGNGWQFSQLTRPVNILVMGMSVLPPDIQNPPDHTKNLGYLPQLNSFDGLSDVMLLLKFDPQTKKIVMLSIPRDTRAEIEGVGTKKINSANVNGGPALTAKTVSNLLGGVAIDRYIRINVLGVGKLIDALGGITVYVPKDMKYQDDSQHLYINLKAGKQHLSGDQALQLLRFRHDALGDIGRIQRQQMVLRALFEQSVNGATLTRFPQILETIKEHIDTNLSIEELMALLGFGTGTNRSNIEMLMLPGGFSENGKYGASYWIPDQEAIQKLAVKNFGLGASWMDTQETIDPSRLRIAIQDSTGEGQSVRGLINTLQQAGYVNVSRVSRGAGEPLETTHIVAQQGDSNSAESVRQVLGFGEVRVESTGDIGSDITIQVGRDWLRKSQEF